MNAMILFESDVQVTGVTIIWFLVEQSLITPHDPGQQLHAGVTSALHLSFLCLFVGPTYTIAGATFALHLLCL